MKSVKTGYGERIATATKELLRTSSLNKETIKEAEEWMYVLHSNHVEDIESVPPFIAYLAEKASEMHVFHNKEDYETEAISSIAFYLELHPAERKNTTQFPSPYITFTELVVSKHPNFDLYLADKNGNEYWLNNGRIGIKPKFKDFLERRLKGRITKCDTYGDFQLIVEVSQEENIFAFMQDDYVEPPKNYFHIIETDRGYGVSEFIEYLDDNQGKEQIDGLHEQTFA